MIITSIVYSRKWRTRK